MDHARPRTVLLTGASSGIGRATVLLLEHRGYRVFAGVRREADALELGSAGGGCIIPLVFDITDPAAVRGVAERLEAELGEHGLDALVNNAGVVVAAPLELVPLEDVREQFEVNVTGPLGLTQALLPLLRRARGRIVNVGSVSGSFSTPFTGPYNASKSALRALSDALRVELAPWGMTVSIIEPGTVHTPMWRRTLGRIQHLERKLPPAATALYGPVFDRMREFIATSRGVTAATVAAVIARALSARRPRPYYPVGADARFRLLLERLPTRVRDFLIASQLPKYPAADR